MNVCCASDWEKKQSDSVIDSLYIRLSLDIGWQRTACVAGRLETIAERDTWSA
jgi:threonine aldolase